jgi:aryl-alcohol dehydrogenase-like predicted oxidoreductase
MSFGTEWGWGIEINEARKMLDLYVDNGGNFVDTANFYTNGSSEKMLGEFLGEKRQQIVLSTKYTMNTHPGDPNGGGNHRKSMVRSVETSLQRLKTDYIDLLYLHIWDGTTPVEEILRAMDDLVRAGKVLLSKSTVTSVLLGASKLEQLENNLGSLNTHLSPDQIKRLDDISRVEMGFPHAILANPTIKQTISGGVEVHRK